MLPFMAPKKLTTMIMDSKKPDAAREEEGEPEHALMSAAEDLITAIHAKDAKRVAEALQAAMEMAEMPEEGSEEGMI